MARVSIVVVLLCVVAGVVTWYAGGRYQFTPRNFGVVDLGDQREGTAALFRSGQISTRMLEPTLTKFGIDTVIFLSGDNLKRKDTRSEIAVCASLGIERINRPLAGDGTGQIQKYIDALTDAARARSAGRAVLVHCHTGSQRTGAFVAFHRLLIDGWTAERTKAELLAYGHDPAENEKLIPYVNRHLSTVAAELVSRGVIVAAPSPLPKLVPGR